LKAYCFAKFGVGLDGLMLDERPEPKPGRNEVVIEVRARSLNYRDLLILAGVYPIPARVGATALSDGAGEVVAVGDDVTRVAIGDRVTATYFPRWIDGRFSMDLASEQFGCARDGMLAQFVVASEQAVVKIPVHLSFEEAATLPCAAVTAWAALVGPKPVLPGETVLTIGSGGVALFALQFAKLFGARVITITSSDAKIERLKQLGADEVINHRSTPEWGRAIRDLTSGHGVEHVVETGSAETLATSINCAAAEGMVSVVAALGAGSIDARSVFANPALVRRTYVGSRAHMEAANKAIAQHRMRPVIDRVFEFPEARQAYEYFEARKHMGKVVIAGD
jgi:NADPH:quinone reductase-like Zn-dependent oxidoreductase